MIGACTLTNAVSEPIALKLRQSKGNIYLHAQVYTGFMYIAAALCMWLLRAWKIGELEAIVAEQKVSTADLDPVNVEQSEVHRTISATSRAKKSSISKRLLAWKKV